MVAEGCAPCEIQVTARVPQRRLRVLVMAAGRERP